MSAANGGCGMVRLNAFQTINIKDARNAQPDLRLGPLMERSERGWFDSPDAVLSGSSAEPDNTNGSKSNHQHKEASGVRLKCAT